MMIRSSSRMLLTGLFVLSLGNLSRSQTFTDLGANLDGAAGFGAAAWGDYDNDGDLDLIYSGASGPNSNPNPRTRLYRNDNGAFVNVPATLPNLQSSSLAWGDYDNDGDLDLLLIGSDAQFVSRGGVFRNDNGAFTAIGLSLPDAGATASWVDFDNDGDLDIFLAGFALFGTGPRLYRNNGGNSFTLMATTLPQISGGDGAWGDYDNDGDLDLLIAGNQSSVGPVAKIFRNDGAGGGNTWSFTDAGANLSGGGNLSSAAWGDYDADSDLDLALTSGSGAEYVTRIYRNNNGAFSDIGGNITGVQVGDVAWGDFDSDGDLDLLIAGLGEDNGVLQNHLRLYRNDNGTFVDSGIALPGLKNCTLAWGDYDGDGDLDFFVMGNQETGQVLTSAARIYRNDGGPANTRPNPPTILFANFNDQGELALAWNPGSDIETPVDGLTYNLRVGTTPGGAEIIAPMALNTGELLIAQSGNANHNRLWTIANVDTTQTYYWSVQTVDNHFAGSVFAPEQMIAPGPGVVIDTSFKEIDFDLMALASSDAQWGDYDGDGDLDVAITGGVPPGTGFTDVYRNDGGVGFTRITTSLLNVFGGALAWCDNDRDGDLDLLVSGADQNGAGQTTLFRNSGNDTFDFLFSNFTGVASSALDWGDYDRDGDYDLLLAGNSANGPVAQVLQNSGNNIFADIQAGLSGVRLGDATWFDFDNDRDLDIWLNGEDNLGNFITRVYEQQNQTFLNSFAPIAGVWYSALEAGDYDHDGDLDIAVIGARDDFDPTPQDANPLTAIYRNDISSGGFFTLIPANLIAVSRGDLDWGDYDADGDLDLLITGYDGINTTARIYRNDGSDQFQEVDPQITTVTVGAVEWGDYDNDGRLDILLTGQNSAAQPTTKIYRNTRNEANTPPAPPISGFSATLNGNTVSLNWGEGSDAQAPASGLTYNLRVGTTPGGEDIIAPMSLANGKRELARRGNAEHNRRWVINNLPSGTTFYWSVQAVDASYAGSAFSAEQTFATATAFNFTEIALGQPGLSNGDLAWGDFDNDGDLDFVAMGFQANIGATTFLYRNNNGSFADAGISLPQLRDGALAWGDYDSDGDLDVVLTGLLPGQILQRYAAIHRNDGLTFPVAHTLTAVYQSAVAWGDLDQDGDLDLALAGLIEQGAGPSPDSTITAFYRNEARGRVMALTASRINGAAGTRVAESYNGGLALVDFDKNSKLDLFISGHGRELLDVHSVVYTHLAYSRGEVGVDDVPRYYSFAALQVPLPGVSFSAAAWGDYDSDGFPDLLYNGIGNFSQIYTRLYHNDNGQGLTEVPAGLPNLSDGDVAWGDLDNDGDLDIVLCGADENDQPVTMIFENLGGSFRAAQANLENVRSSALALGDYDNDGDLDILLLGYNGSASVTKLYRNDSPVANTPPSVPTGLTAVVNGEKATLSWNPSTDAQTASSALTYNVRIGTTADPVEVAPSHSAADGWRRIVALGNAGQKTSVTFKIDPATSYRWSVQAIDNNFAGSAFAPEAAFGRSDGISFFNVWPDTMSRNSSALTWSWADYDGDGDPDVFTDGFDEVYRNDGDGRFARRNLGSGIRALQSEWGDFDNDGDPDLLISGAANLNLPPYYVRIYNNDAGNFVQGAQLFSSNQEDVRPRLAAADFDNDGWLDVLIAPSVPFQAVVPELHRNRGDGTFELVATAIPAIDDARFAWADYDNDGDLDVYLDGRNDHRLHRNDGAGDLTSVPVSTNFAICRLLWRDYDNDGDLDIIAESCGGSYFPLQNQLLPTGSPDLISATETFSGVFESEVIDTDNDGNLEIWAHPNRYDFQPDGSIAETRVFFTSLDFDAKAWGDYDGDGDLDLIIIGEPPNTQEPALIRLYRNDSPPAPNVPPQAPTGLTATVAGNFVTLSWNAATDDFTPSQTLTYNLRIGTTPGGNDVVSSLALGNGTRKIVAMGNANLARSRRYQLEPNTTYYWSVQAIDQALAGGAFAPEQSFTTTFAGTLVRFTNASGDPGLNPLDGYLGGGSSASLAKIANDVPVLNDLPFRNGSALLPVPADSSLTLLIAPGNSAGSAEAVAQFDNLTFPVEQTLLITVLGVSQPAQFAPNPDGRNIALALHIHDVTRSAIELDSNQAAIYFVHGATDAPAVDLVRRDDGVLLAENIVFGEASAFIFIEADRFAVDVVGHASRDTLAGYSADFEHFAGAIVPVLLSGFVDPAANQNGPRLAVTAIEPNGDVITRVESSPESQVPTDFVLFQNYPNPFNPVTSIRYSVSSYQWVSLKVYDVLGKEVATLVDERQAAGKYTVSFDGTGLASGVYFAKLQADKQIRWRKMLLVR